MHGVENGIFPRDARADAFRAPVLDPATVDFYLRRGREERARAFAEMIRGIFSSPPARAPAEVHELPARRREAVTECCAGRTDRAA
jgi:hypothetical protein